MRSCCAWMKRAKIQALQRSQPIMPLRSGSIKRHTPEYFRPRTPPLFAALDVKKGQILGNCHTRHRSEGFLSFRKQLEKHGAADVAAGKSIHLSLDNYCIHKCRQGHALAGQTSALASALHTHARFLAQSGGTPLCQHYRRGDPQRQLSQCWRTQKTTDHYLSAHNQQPKPFRRTADANTILAKNAHLCNELQ